MTEDTDWKLVQRCLNGDLKAYEVLIDKYEKAIFNVALKMLHDVPDAEDVTQTVFLNAYENLSRFNPRYKFFSWIYRMAINESINLSLKKKRMVPFDATLESPETGPEDAFEASRLTESIEKALMFLKPEYRALVILKHFHGCSYAELAYIMEIPEKTVKSRLFSARHQLRDILVKKGLLNHG